MKSKKLKHYRPTRYRRHRAPVDRRVLIVAVSFVLMLAGSIALGSYLGSLADELPSDTDTSYDTLPESPSYDEYPKLAIEKTAVMPLTADAYTKDAQADKFVMKAAGSLWRAVSIDLVDLRGVPRYDSEIYERAYAAPSGNIDLGNLIEKANKSGISLSATFSYKSENAEYADIRAIRESYELALISEVYSIGIRELTLTDVECADIDTLYCVVKKIKQRAPELRVGITLSPAECTEAEYLARIDDVFDFIALDLSEAFSADVALYASAEYSSDAQYSLAAALREHFFTLERYPSRVYIRLAEESAQAFSLARNILEAEQISSYLISGVYDPQTNNT